MMVMRISRVGMGTVQMMMMTITRIASGMGMGMMMMSIVTSSRRCDSRSGSRNCIRSQRSPKNRFNFDDAFSFSLDATCIRKEKFFVPLILKDLLLVKQKLQKVVYQTFVQDLALRKLMT